MPRLSDLLTAARAAVGTRNYIPAAVALADYLLATEPRPMASEWYLMATEARQQGATLFTVYATLEAAHIPLEPAAKIEIERAFAQ